MSARIAVDAEDLRTVLHHEPHCHTVPDRWDWGGGPCGVCEARTRLKEALYAPTPEVGPELAVARQYAADLAEDLAVSERSRGEIAAARDRLAGDVRRLESQIEAVRDLHTESPAGFCPSCGRLGDVSDVDDGLVAHPCPTLRALSNPTSNEEPSDDH